MRSISLACLVFIASSSVAGAATLSVTTTFVDLLASTSNRLDVDVGLDSLQGEAEMSEAPSGSSVSESAFASIDLTSGSMAALAIGSVPSNEPMVQVSAQARAAIGLKNTGSTPIALDDGWLSLSGAMEFGMAMGNGPGAPSEFNASGIWGLTVSAGSGSSESSAFDTFIYGTDREAGPTRVNTSTSDNITFRPVINEFNVFYFTGFDGSLSAGGLTLAPDESLTIMAIVGSDFGGVRRNQAGRVGTYDPESLDIVPLTLAMLLPAGTIFDDGGRDMAWVSVAPSGGPDPVPAPIPLPPAAMMLATALGGLGLVSRRRRLAEMKR